VLDLLLQEKVLVVQGSGFNWQESDHFRVVFLPHVEQLKEALTRLGTFLKNYRQ
jgi:alanine-synthesizing transaminase